MGRKVIDIQDELINEFVNQLNEADTTQIFLTVMENLRNDKERKMLTDLAEKYQVSLEAEDDEEPETDEESYYGLSENDWDEIVLDAIDFGRLSVSRVQQLKSIGYSDASKICDSLVACGIFAKSRINPKILVPTMTKEAYINSRTE